MGFGGPITFHDNQLNVDCIIPLGENMSDGRLHCIPNVDIQSWFQGDFADSACTQPVVVVPKGTSCGAGFAPPVYFAQVKPNTLTDWCSAYSVLRVYSFGPEYDPSTLARVYRNCNGSPSSAAPNFVALRYFATTELPPSMFVTFAPQ
jgi:hypothetical protein